jgi:hypothetical protein
MVKPEALPTLRGDRMGYILGDRSIDGFEDRPDLGPRARQILARMAERCAPETLSEVKRSLLAESEREPPQPSALLVALTRNLEELNEAYQAGLFGDLSAEEVALVRDPANHSDLSRASYPLSIGQTAKVTGASPVQLRRWAEARLIPSLQIRGRLHFLGAGVLHAMLLAKAEKYEVAALMRILRGEEAGGRLVRLLGITLASISAAVEERDEAGHEVALAGDTLIRCSETIRRAAEAYSTRVEDISHVAIAP